MRLKSGFTLVELAIVIVIIGLLVGGVLAGQELIKQAQIRNIMSQIREYNTAANTFRAKYNSLPGDFDKAYEFGIDKPQGSSVRNVAAAGVIGNGNGNGNNDGIFQNGTCCYYTLGAYLDGEITNFWVHLSNLGLIKQNFSQIENCNDSGCLYFVGEAMPSLKLGNSGIAIFSDSGLNSTVYVLGIKGSSFYNIEGDSEGQDDSIYSDALTPEESYALDSKLDDGSPTTGIMTVISGYTPSDINQVSPPNVYGPFTFNLDSPSSSDCALSSTNYNLSLEQQTCTLRLKSEF